MNEFLTAIRRNIPIFVGALSGVFLTFGFTLFGWFIFIVAAILQANLIKRERDD